MILRYRNVIALLEEEFNDLESALEAAKELYEKGYEFEIIDNKEKRIYGIKKTNLEFDYKYKFIQIIF